MAIFKLSTGLYEALYELQEMNQSLFNKMLRTDFKELEARKNGLISESAIKTLHEGVIDSIWKGIKEVIKWFIDKIKDFWALFIGFFKKKSEKIKADLKKQKANTSPDKEDEGIEVEWFENIDNASSLYEAFHSIPLPNSEIKEENGKKILVITSDIEEFGVNFIEKIENVKPIRKVIYDAQKIFTSKKIESTFNSIQHNAELCKNYADEIIGAAEKLQKNLDAKPEAIFSSEYENTLDSDDPFDKRIIAGINNYFSQVMKAHTLIEEYFTEIMQVFEILREKMAAYAQDHPFIYESSIDRSYLLDFIDEMVEHDFNEAIDNCHIDDLGHPVYAF